MMRRIGFVVGFCLLVAYSVFLYRVFQTRSIKGSKIDSVVVTSSIGQAFGNANLQCLLILANGSAEFVDAESSIKVTKLEPAARFLAGMLSDSGTAFLMDDRRILYRWSSTGDLTKSKPLKVDGVALAIAVEEQSRVLWCAMRRQGVPHVGLTVYAINLENGKVIGSANLESNPKSAFFVASKDGSGVLIATSDSPGAFFFRRVEKSVESRYLKADELVYSALFDGHDVLLGLRSGQVERYALQSGSVTQSYQTDYLPVTQIAKRESLLAIAHGDGDSRVGVGSSYLIDLKSGDVVQACGAKDQVMAITVEMAGQAGGTLSVLSADKVCQSLEVPVLDRPKGIRFLASRMPICLVISDSAIQRIELPAQSR